jgi:hypothetical protein
MCGLRDEPGRRSDPALAFPRDLRGHIRKPEVNHQISAWVLIYL